ncbi:MAG TPA: thiol:disulfide interchange protein DsbA/DsbL [Gammaproteobacteria bacterium]
MKKWLLLPILMLASAAASADMTSFTEGVNYVAVNPPQSTDVKPGQVEVIEFYWYGCPHCFALEPFVELWEKRKPKDVVFKRVPAAMKGSEFYVDAQAAFTADVLGVGEKIREPFFNAIHLDNQGELRDDKDAIKAFFGKYGVKPADFDGAWDSFGVQSRIAQSQQLGNRYDVQGVPTVIVNGKWKTGAGYGMGSADIMKCVEFLIAKERAAGGKH